MKGNGGTAEAPPAQNGEAHGRLSPDEIREQLQKILDSPAFEASERRKRFLRYVVEEMLAGRADRLKGYSIATAVFDRDDASIRRPTPWCASKRGDCGARSSTIT